jgi:hypothetical protein
MLKRLESESDDAADRFAVVFNEDKKLAVLADNGKELVTSLSA